MNATTDHLNNQTAFQRFLDVYSQRLRKLIIFCGAGASKEAGLPDWDGLVQAVRQDLNQPLYATSSFANKIQKFDLEEDFWIKLSIAREIFGENYTNIIQSILDKETIWTVRRRCLS
ncbi:hypothetical protein [Mycoplana sp. MJR14]|uniref:hypothetical protein n=1 Tax=Mycoplana sp. MJR14 TaxID=3032583 RepID=UPI0023D98ABC|nr:hypothetical protein [Mycoplana sp. MJR14]MDF1633920.1 hypothetical protein [Mycoplana sp. MJR14]